VKKRTIVFLHGFASSSRCTKAEYLRKEFQALPEIDFSAIDFNPTPRDFEYVTTTGLIARLRQYVLDRQLDEFSIIGSSFGGLVAILYAQRFGGVERMVLLAPGLRWLSGGLSNEQLEAWKRAGVAPIPHPAFEQEVPVRYDLQKDGLHYLEPVPPPAPMVIIHGSSDQTVPTDDSREYARRYPDKVQLIEVEADHDLNGHMCLIWDSVQSFLLDA
jgi:pimeloyl-ACP methyl ester carboxylesterase